MTPEEKCLEQIIRHHAHEVRNHLNGLELEATLLAELSTDANVLESLVRTRAELSHLGAAVKSLVFKFAEPQPIHLRADDLLQLWKFQIGPWEDVDHKISWLAPLDSPEVRLDAHAIVSVLRALVMAAWTRSPGAALQGVVRTTAQTVFAELREPIPKVPPGAEAWLEHRRLVELNGGTLAAGEDRSAGQWVSALSFPAIADP